MKDGDLSEPSWGTSRINGKEVTMTPMTRELKNDNDQFLRDELEAGSAPWRPRDAEAGVEEYVDVAIAGTQVWAVPGEGAEVTIINARTWASYIQQAREEGWDVSDYDQYRTMSKKERIRFRRIVVFNGARVHVHGPFSCWLQIASSRRKTEVYVSSDPTIERNITPGRGLWEALPIMVCVARELGDDAQAWVQQEKSMYRALLDTGAARSLISMKDHGTNGEGLHATTTTESEVIHDWYYDLVCSGGDEHSLFHPEATN